MSDLKLTERTTGQQDGRTAGQEGVPKRLSLMRTRNLLRLYTKLINNIKVVCCEAKVRALINPASLSLSISLSLSNGSNSLSGLLSNQKQILINEIPQANVNVRQ